MRRPSLQRRRAPARTAACTVAIVLAGAFAVPDGAPLGAQAASVRGSVHDSLFTRGPLAGAVVVLHGTTRSATTDRRGRYELPDVPAGVYAIGFFHPLLDTLGIAAPAERLVVPDSLPLRFDLSVPSAGGVTRTLCGADAEPSSAVVFGQVRAAEDDAPLAGARALVTWYELALTGRSPRQVLRQARSLSDATGRFALCNVPNDIALTLRVDVDGQATGALQLALDTLPVVRRDVWVSRTDTAARFVAADDSRDTSPRPPGRAALAVRVRDALGAPVSGAIIGVRGAPVSATSDANGLARLTRLPSGSQTLVVRAVGYEPAHELVALRPEDRLEVEVALGTFAPELPSVAVVGARSRMAAFDAGFDRRRQMGVGYFFDEPDLGEGPSSSAFWSKVPGVTATTERGPDVLPLMRGFTGAYCIPHIFLNGMRMGRVDAWEIRSWLLGARRLEVYPRAADVPGEFAPAADDPCGVIVIWTR